MGLRAPTECFQAPAAAASSFTRAPKRSRHVDRRGSSHKVCSPSASSRTRQRTRGPGLPHPAACAFRFSQPPGALFRHVPAGLVSCRIRSWGCTLQSFPPLAWPYAVSGASPLLSFGRIRRARLADVPTVARAPLAVAETTARETRTLARSEDRSSPGLTCPRKPPRLQGFAPRESPPLPAGGLGRRRRVALLGFSPSRALLTRQRPGFHRASPHGLSLIGRERPMSRPFRVSIAARWAHLSRDRRPSWASAPCDHHER